MAKNFSAEGAQRGETYKVRGLEVNPVNATTSVIIQADKEPLKLRSASFVFTGATGTNAASAVKLQLGINGDVTEFSAVGNIPANAAQFSRVDMHLNEHSGDTTLEIGESLIGTTVGLADLPTAGFWQAEVGPGTTQ